MIFMVLGICGLTWILKKWWYKSGGVLVEKQGQDKKKVVVFGASQSGNKAMRRLEDFNIIIEGFTDNNTKKWGKQFSGKPVFPPEEIFRDKESYLIIISSVYEDEIMQQCLDAGMDKDSVYILEDFIIQQTGIFMKRYSYLEGIKPYVNNERTLVITVPNKNNEYSGVTSWMYSVAYGLASINAKFLVLTEEMGDEMPACAVQHVVPYNSYAFEEDTGDGIRIRTGKDYPGLYKKETDSLVHIMMQNLPCTVITSETYGAEYVATYILKKLFPGLVKVVTVIHSDEKARYKRGIWHEKDLDGYLCVAESSLGKWEKEYNVPSWKLFYHEFPVLCTGEGQHAYSKENEPVRLGFLGRLEVNAKRCDLLVKITQELEKKKINYSLSIAGEGSYKEELKKFIEENSLQDRLVLAGFVKHSSLGRFWNDKDICIITSDYEGSCTAVMEAMSYGAVPVVTNFSSAGSLVDDGTDGYIVPAGGYKDIADKICSLYYSRDLIEKMGNMNKEKMSGKYSPEGYAAYLVKMQEEIWERSSTV